MRPFIVLNQVQSLDGAMADAKGRSVGLGSPTDRLVMDLLRAEMDLVACGAATVRADDPWLHVRTAAACARRQAQRPDAAPHPWAAVFTQGGPWPSAARCLRVPLGVDPAALPPLLRVHVAGGPKAARAAASGAAGRTLEHVEIRAGHDALVAFAEALFARGIERIVLEGGARLAAAFFAADLIDEIFVTVAPKWLGQRVAQPQHDARALRLIEAHKAGDELFTRWRVEKSSARSRVSPLHDDWLGEALHFAEQSLTQET